MQEVLLRHNEFTGEISLEHLPKGLNVLILSGNQLRGTVCLTSLPVRLHSLDLSENTFGGSLDLTRLPGLIRSIDLGGNEFTANPTKDTSPWWVGPVPQFLGKPRTFLNPSSCFCHNADPIDGHRKVVGQDEYPAVGEVRETAT